MRVTIRDVAEKAGVSPSTVSRAIYNTAKISDATKERIFRAMEELHYYPNAAARSLANRQAMTLGIILPNSEEDLFINPFFIDVMRGISIYAQSEGYYLMYAFSKDQEQEVKFIKDLYNTRRVDGIISLSVSENDKCIQYMKERETPFVVVGRPEDPEGILWVDNDNFQAMYNLVSLLLDRGIRSFGFIGGPKNLTVTRDRLEGFIKALENRGISAANVPVAFATDFSEQAGYRIGNGMLETAAPACVVTTDDILAFGVLKAAAESEAGTHVTGFNNTFRSSSGMPAITTVEIHPYEIGRKAARLLIDRLKDPENSADHFIVGTKLIERGPVR